MRQKQKFAFITNHRFFAAFYEHTSQGESEKCYLEPLRKEIVAQAQGLVLEVGAGNGLNFGFYNPAHVEQVEAIEQVCAMLGYARKRAKAVRVPVILTQTPVEQLPFADAYFDSIVCTLVFCSVNAPLRGLQEMRRVLKPGGRLLMIEHVRSQNHLIAFIQDLITPLTRFLAGNCHRNRNIVQIVSQAGFQQAEFEWCTLGGVFSPMMMLSAKL